MMAIRRASSTNNLNFSRCHQGRTQDVGHLRGLALASTQLRCAEASKPPGADSVNVLRGLRGNVAGTSMKVRRLLMCTICTFVTTCRKAMSQTPLIASSSEEELFVKLLELDTVALPVLSDKS